jgi:hypothetical protein
MCIWRVPSPVGRPLVSDDLLRPTPREAEAVRKPLLEHQALTGSGAPCHQRRSWGSCATHSHCRPRFGAFEAYPPLGTGTQGAHLLYNLPPHVGHTDYDVQPHLTPSSRANLVVLYCVAVDACFKIQTFPAWQPEQLRCPTQQPGVPGLQHPVCSQVSLASRDGGFLQSVQVVPAQTFFPS